MQSNYNIESESDEEEDEEEEPQITVKSMAWRPDDVDKLQHEAQQIMDPSWKLARSAVLLKKMLDLEQPAITVKMVDFLLSEGVTEVLISFITQLSPSSVRPTQSDAPTDGLILSYKVTSFIATDNPSEALMSYLGKRATLITKLLFQIFQSDSAGSFYHAFKVLECLIRSFPSEVYQGICYDGNASERMSNAIRYIGYAPVCELLVMVIGLTPIARTSQLFIMSAKSRYSFFEELCGWNLMLQITNVVTAPDKCCQIDGSVTGEQHSCAATLLMQELVEKLSLEDSGELLLQPFGYTTELLDQLIDTAINNKALTFLRSHSAKIVCFLLRRAAEAEIMCFINYGTGAPPTATFVANRLYPLRERIVNHVRTRLNDINDSLITFESFMVGIDSVKYSSYEVKIPFTALRSLNVELLVLMAESDETVAGAIPPELWKLFMNWSIVYANNNIYHSLFYRLVFAVLRQGQEDAQKVLFDKANLVGLLAEHFISYDYPIPPKDSDAYDLTLKRSLARGIIVNCGNATRLQSSLQSPNSFLSRFLHKNDQWKTFVEDLLVATEYQLRFGMGITVSVSDRPGMANALAMMAEPIPIGEPPRDDPLDHRSRFARSLGFYDDGTSVAHTPPAEGIDASMIMAAEEEDAPYEKSYGSSEDVESVAASLTRALDLEHSLSASASDDNSNSNGVGLPVPPSIEKVGDNTDIKPSSSTEEVPIIISPEH